MRRKAKQETSPTTISFAGTPKSVLERVKGFLIYMHKSRKSGKVQKKLLRFEVAEALKLTELERFLLLEVADFLQMQELVRMITAVIVAESPLKDLQRVQKLPLHLVEGLAMALSPEDLLNVHVERLRAGESPGDEETDMLKLAWHRQYMKYLDQFWRINVCEHLSGDGKIAENETEGQMYVFPFISFALECVP